MLNSRDITLTHWYFQKKYTELVENCAKRNVKFLTVGTVRDQEYQSYIYEQGRSRNGNIVTNAKYTSFHRNDVGLAADLVPIINGKIDWNAQSAYDIIHEEARKLGFTVGADWKSFPENAHIQLDEGLSSKDILAGKRPSWFYNKPVENNVNAFDILKNKSIICRIGFDWEKLCNENQFIQGEYCKALIVNFYKYKTKKWSFTFGEAVQYLVDNKISSDGEYWMTYTLPNQKCSGSNVKILIERMAKMV